MDVTYRQYNNTEMTKIFFKEFYENCNCVVFWKYDLYMFSSRRVLKIQQNRILKNQVRTIIAVKRLGGGGVNLLEKDKIFSYKFNLIIFVEGPSKITKLSEDDPKPGPSNSAADFDLEVSNIC